MSNRKTQKSIAEFYVSDKKRKATNDAEGNGSDLLAGGLAKRSKCEIFVELKLEQVTNTKKIDWFLSFDLIDTSSNSIHLDFGTEPTPAPAASSIENVANELESISSEACPSVSSTPASSQVHMQISISSDGHDNATGIEYIFT